MATDTKTYVKVGDTFRVRLPYSEVCMFMKIAGKVMLAQLISNHAVQLFDDDGSVFSSPITNGEAGVFAEYVYDNGDIVDVKHYITDGELVSAAMVPDVDADGIPWDVEGK